MAEKWIDDYAESEAEDIQINEYDITATPNDFNVLTIVQFIESGAVIIPGFQRNFVWDIKRSSKLIESLILGLPVPQVFLYEEGKNRYLVIDGQQRLLTIYYFVKGRFPRKEKRAQLRKIFAEHHEIPERILDDDTYFRPFKLTLPERLPRSPNKFNGKKYTSLEEYKTQLDLRTVRNVIVKQNQPSNDDSSVFEIFNRLNTGGVNLKPQEVRASLYHSPFYDLLQQLNLRPRWRRVIGSVEPDLHMKDVEILLRCFAMLMLAHKYAPSMTKFLNTASKRFKALKTAELEYFEELFDSFLDATRDLKSSVFQNPANKRLNLALLEATFVAICYRAADEKRTVEGVIDADEIKELGADTQFNEAAIQGTTKTESVQTRLKRAKIFVSAL